MSLTTSNMFDNETTEQQEKLYADQLKNKPKNLVPEGLELKGNLEKERRIPVSFTMTPTLKDELSKVAKKNGYTSTSAYVVDVLQQIVDLQN